MVFRFNKEDSKDLRPGGVVEQMIYLGNSFAGFGQELGKLGGRPLPGAKRLCTEGPRTS